MQFLKQSTATTVLVGPAVDKNDGVTPETGLAAGTVDEIGVYKHEATSLTDISGTTTFTHRAGGMYTMTLGTGDTGTLGRMTAYLRDDSVCLPVWQEFEVIPSNIYDLLFGASDSIEAIRKFVGNTRQMDQTGANPVETIFQDDGSTPWKTKTLTEPSTGVVKETVSDA